MSPLFGVIRSLCWSIRTASPRGPHPLLTSSRGPRLLPCLFARGCEVRAPAPGPLLSSFPAPPSLFARGLKVLLPAPIHLAGSAQSHPTGRAQSALVAQQTKADACDSAIRLFLRNRLLSGKARFRTASNALPTSAKADRPPPQTDARARVDAGKLAGEFYE
jgi:hypothetical protein